MAYETRWEARGVLWYYSGRVTVDDLLSSNADVYGDERLERVRYQLLDLSQVAAIELDDSDVVVAIQRVAAFDRTAAITNPNVRVATVASHEALAALALLYESEMDDCPWHSEVFATVAQARAWLDQ